MNGSGQTSLPGFGSPAIEDRLFFAVYPDAATAERIASLALELRGHHGFRGKPLAPERLHVTLHHLGDYAGVPNDVVRMAGDAAARITGAPFGIGFDRATSFGARRGRCPFVLLGDSPDIQAMVELQRRLGDAMKASGLARHVEPNFTPHVTLLYDDRVVAEERIEPIRWQVGEFVLVHSLIGHSRHIPLARWTLR
ncbi:2'-5' RNA ligase family protein [Dokdonella sp.]|uniref:2'-5' RNA ligase family protein n=1 Tax=Dokdonella sp. TaxID=2291710 RepID=UPI00261D79A8|nr:2'-5' RNA ligase family protein [Dokdonella sp.]